MAKAKKRAKSHKHGKNIISSLLGLFKHRSSRKNAQSLPMTTIVLIIIAMVVLAVVVIFFFGQFGSGNAIVNDQVNIGSNMTSNLKCETWSTGFTVISDADCYKCPLEYKNTALAKGAKIKTTTTTCVVGNIGANPCTCIV